jgi:hypothetical protein
MKNRMLPLLAAALSLSISSGCHAAQQPQSPVDYVCPTASWTGGNYTEINPPSSNTVAASITGTTYDWSPPSVGAWCLIVQAWGLPAGQTIYQVSGPSNVAEATTTTADSHVQLSWTGDVVTSTYASYTYIASYVPATAAATPTAPPLTTTTTSSRVVKPALAPQQPAPLAYGPRVPLALTAKLERPKTR